MRVRSTLTGLPGGFALGLVTVPIAALVWWLIGTVATELLQLPLGLLLAWVIYGYLGLTVVLPLLIALAFLAFDRTRLLAFGMIGGITVAGTVLGAAHHLMIGF